MFKIERIDHVALTVGDIDRSIRWYQDTLGLERRYEEAWGNQPAVLCAGENCLALFPSHSMHNDLQPGHRATGMRHVAFATDQLNFERAQADLLQRGIQFSFEDHGISQSIYFFDPDGHQLEITTYDLTQHSGNPKR